MPLLQGDLMEPSFEEKERAKRIADRLLGYSPLPGTSYVGVIAEENLWTGDLVTYYSPGIAKKWDTVSLLSGIAISPIGKGCFGWIQMMS